MSQLKERLPEEIKVMGVTLRQVHQSADDLSQRNVYRFKRSHLTRDFSNVLYVSINRTIDPRGKRRTTIIMSFYGRGLSTLKIEKYDWIVSNKKLEEKILSLIESTSRQIYDRACELSRRASEAVAVSAALDRIYVIEDDF